MPGSGVLCPLVQPPAVEPWVDEGWHLRPVLSCFQTRFSCSFPPSSLCEAGPSLCPRVAEGRGQGSRPEVPMAQPSWSAGDLEASPRPSPPGSG